MLSLGFPFDSARLAVRFPPDFESVGRGFEPLRARQENQGIADSGLRPLACFFVERFWGIFG